MEFWCGDETAAQKYAVMMLNPPAQAFVEHKAAGSAFEGSYYGPAIAEMVGDIAMVRVAGSLMAGSAGWRQAYGMIGYEDIKAAIVEAVGRQDVKGIMMYFDTGGGQVNGVESTARLIGEAGKFKPVTGYAATAASAGYWLASATQYLVADNTSVLGSLGSIMQLVNLVDAYSKQGITWNTFKSGTLKMAGNPNEELSEEAKAYFQTHVEDMTSIFYNQIARNRGMDVTEMRRDFGDGRGVLGPRALAGGLIDEIGGVGAALAKVRALVQEKAANIPAM